MENLRLEATNNTPFVNCDSSKNTIEITGESRPENVRAFYAPVFEWIEGYEKVVYYATSLSTNEKKITLDFNLDYFNSSTLKVFMEIIEKLKNMSSNIEHVSLTINWRYDEDDEDILDSGKEFEKMTGAKMVYIPNN